MGMAFGQSLLAYHTNGKPHPFSASFVVSNRCNIHCSYCNFPTLKTKDLSLIEITVLFNNLKKLGVKRLGLLGGEPLLRKDIGEIIDIAKRLDFFVSVNSNLLLYEKKKEQLKDVDYYFTSIDGRPETHILNRGKQDFGKIIDAIRSIKRSGRNLTAICVLNKQVFEDVDYLIQFAKTENITVHFQPECYDTEYVANSAVELNNDEIKKLWKYILGQKQNGAPISSSLAYLEFIVNWDNYAVSSIYNAEKKCAAGRGYLLVDAEGYGYPCAYTKGKMEGVNLLTDDWDKKFSGNTPCTQCIVGPMLEFNMLFDKPVASVYNALRIV
jgi:MoaA/NifB/PqqE/SkfB family radical SAM enzyme